MPKNLSYEVKLTNSKWQKRLTRVHLSSRIDRYSKLELSFAFNEKELGELSLNDYPQSALLKWANRTQFVGDLASVRLLESSQIIVRFVDKIFILKKTYKNDTLKPQSLRSAISALIRDTGVQAHFRGDFSTEIPGFSLSGQSIYQHLRELSDKCGFQFHYRAEEERLEVIKIGSHIDKAQIDCDTHKITDVRLVQSACEATEELSYSYFDPNDMQKKENRLTSNQLYSLLPTTGTLYKEKLKWPCAKGKKEAVLTDRQQFDSAPNIFASQYSKRLTKQEVLKLVGLSPIGLPADRVEIEQMPASRIGSGNYNIAGCEILIQGCQPQTTIFATRA